MHRLKAGIMQGLLAVVYIAVFRQIWMGVYAPDIMVYAGVFGLLAFFTYMLLHGAYYILHNGKKTEAQLLAADNGLTCIAAFEIAGKKYGELLAVNRRYGIIPGECADIYVILHREGKKETCEIRTQADIRRNLCAGILCAAALSGWIILFILRGV